MENKTWHTFRNRHIPAVLPIYVYWPYSLIKKVEIKPGRRVSIWDNGDFKGIWEEETIKEMEKYALNYLEKNKENLKEVRKQGIRAGEKVITICKKFSEKVENTEYEGFINFLKKLEKAYTNFTKKSMLLWIFTGGLIEKKLKKIMQEYSVEEKKEIFEIMTLPKFKSYSQIEEEEFNNLIKFAKNKGLEDKSVKESIKKFSEKYFWFPYEYVGPEIWDEKKITQRVKESLSQSEEKQGTRNINQMQKVCIKKFNLNKEIIDLFNILQTITLMQDDRKMANAHLCYYLNQIILENLAKRLKVTIEQARYIEIELMKDFVKNKDIKKLRKELQEREKFFIMTRKGPIQNFYTGEKGREFLKNQGIQLNADAQTDTIMGAIAYSGKIKGRVRILKTSSNVKDFKNGDILVTGMTTPDFVPLMKKASAIVTDEGGITCHAAIVSRELKIPCIIGTKNATQVLKDGMKVEVDANKGIVKILKK